MPLRTRVFSLALERGWSVSELARRMGLAPATLYYVYRGERQIGARFIAGARCAFPERALTELFPDELAPPDPRTAYGRAGILEEEAEPEPMNIELKRGTLCSDAEKFITRAGLPKIVFRMAVDRAPGRPAKTGRNTDYFTVVALGAQWEGFLTRLKTGMEVLVEGYGQSRDIDNGRTVTETVAEYITLLGPKGGKRE